MRKMMRMAGMMGTPIDEEDNMDEGDDEHNEDKRAQ